MKNNFRYQVGCPLCKFCYRYLGAENWEFYCQLDGTMILDLMNSFYIKDLTNEEAIKIDEIISSHRVSLNTICDDFENKA